MYYQHSGECPPQGPLLAAIPSLLAALVLSWAYAYAILYVPFVGYVTVVLTVGFAALLGVTCSFACRAAKFRNTNLARVLTAVVSVAALYSVYAAWLYALIHRHEDAPDLGPLYFYANPQHLLRAAGAVCDSGVWSLGSFTPSGGALAVLWLIEAAVIVVLPTVLSVTFLGDTFCERCSTWCKRQEGIGRVPRAGAAAIREKVEGRDWAGLLGPFEGRVYCRLDLHVCPVCSETITLTVNEVVIGTDGKGNATQTVTPLVEKLILTSTEVEALREALRAPLRAVKEPEPAAPAEAPAPSVESAPPFPEPAAPAEPVVDPEDEERQAKLRAVGEAARARAEERRRKDDALRDELVPNDSGVVHGPTRAEIIIAALRVVALSPFLIVPTAFVTWVVDLVLGERVTTRNDRLALSVYGTVAVLTFLVPLLLKIGARHLRLVRVKVFEKGSHEPAVELIAIGLYVIVVAIIAFAGN